jgi:hypothetical protein
MTSYRSIPTPKKFKREGEATLSTLVAVLYHGYRELLVMAQKI